MRLRPIIENEIPLLHDSYHHSPEPDAPKKLYQHLNDVEKKIALSTFSTETHVVFLDGDRIIGFAGHYPDQNFSEVHIFAVIVLEHRGKGYFRILLAKLIEHCRHKFPQHKALVSLTRQENVAAIKGLRSLSFKWLGTEIQELDMNSENDVEYQKYIFEFQK